MSTEAIRIFFELAAALPDHLRRGAELARGLPGLPHAAEIDDVAVIGLGTGRSAGMAVRAVAAARSPVPILIESAYELPGSVGPRSLVFAVSGSGSTDEVNHAAWEAAARGARLVCVSVGGWLVDFAGECGAVLVRIPPDIKYARATYGVVIGATLAILEEAGLLSETRLWIDSAVSQLERRRKELARKDNLASALASELVGRHVLCQGDAPLGATAAERWKAQINQNAKQPASASAQPNASHNEAVAWDSPGAREREAAVLLRHAFEDARVGKRMDLLAEYLAGKIPVHQVKGEGGTPFAALMDLIMLGDFTSLHLAEKNGADPSDVTFIAQTVKQGLKPPPPWTRAPKP